MRRPRGPAARRKRLLEVQLGGSVWCLWYCPWTGCGLPCLRPTHPWRQGDPDWVAWEEDLKMKRPDVVVSAGKSVDRVEPPKQLAKLPHLAELLVQPAWDDQVHKGERGALLFISSTGALRLILKVENPPLKLSVTGRTWDEVWAAAEALLRSEDVPWEQDEPRQPKGKRK